VLLSGMRYLVMAVRELLHAHSGSNRRNQIASHSTCAKFKKANSSASTKVVTCHQVQVCRWWVYESIWRTFSTKYNSEQHMHSQWTGRKKRVSKKYFFWRLTHWITFSWWEKPYDRPSINVYKILWPETMTGRISILLSPPSFLRKLYRNEIKKGS